MSCYCGAECGFANADKDDPCEGEVIVVGEESDGEDWYWVHACKRHKNRYY